MSMAETNCAGKRRKSVPVWVERKGPLSPCFFFFRVDCGARSVAECAAICAAPFQLSVSAPPSSGDFAFAFWLCPDRR